jgi:methyl-accepting chemotaxis protein
MRGDRGFDRIGTHLRRARMPVLDEWMRKHSDRQISISAKLAGITGLALLGLLVVATFSLHTLGETLMLDRKQAVQHQVETAYGIIAGYHRQASEGAISESQAQAAAAGAIAQLRFGEDDYFWINDLHPRMVMHPIKPELNGQDLSGVTDPDGVYLFREFADRASDGGGFVAYAWPKPGFEKPQPKMSYVQQFKPWSWVIGTGIYIDDVDAAQWAHGRVLAFQGLLVALIIGLATWWISRGLVRNIRGAVTFAERIAEGELDNALSITANDETGQLLRTLDTMQTDLRERLQRDARIAAENLRVRIALDKVHSCVSVFDRDNRLIYLNDAATGLFTTLCAQHGRDFDVERLQGTDLELLFPDHAAHQRFSERLEQPEQWQQVFGERTVELVMVPVHDANGDYQGQVTQWEDISDALRNAQQEQQRLEEERRTAAANLRLKVALDNAGSNVLVADEAEQVIYMNLAAARLFDAIESDVRKTLPRFAAGNIVGGDIDIFEGHGSHSLRGIQAARQAQLEIGGCHLRFTANPVMAPGGGRLGTVVEWRNRTAEVAVEYEIDGLVEAARAGDLSRRIDLSGKHGFFRQLGEGFNALLDELEGVFGNLADVMGRLAEGHLNTTIAADYSGTFGEVKDHVNRMIERLAQTVSQLRDAAARVEAGAIEITQGNDNLSSRTEQQASSLEQTASSMEQLTATVQHNAENAQQANQVAGTARQVAQHGGEVVTNAVGAMQQISDSSRRIAEIIGVIDEIAFQTNLLALNASVEAARAGEQGRGFAVVATEVRNLAGRSATAAKQIKELIADSVNKVNTGSDLVKRSGESLQEIVDGVKKVNDIVAEIATASRQQAAGIDQVNRAISSIDEAVQQNAALAEETSAASSTMSDSAREMRQLMAFFRTD